MRDFPGGSAVKNLPASAGDARDLGPIPGSGRSPGERWQPTPVLLPGKPYGRRSLAGCSPWGHKSVRHDLVTNRGRNRPTLSSDTTRKSGNAWPRSGGRGSEDTLSPNVVLCVCVCVGSGRQDPKPHSSPTATSCPPIQLHPDSVHPESASDPTG